MHKFDQSTQRVTSLRFSLLRISPFPRTLDFSKLSSNLSSAKRFKSWILREDGVPSSEVKSRLLIREFGTQTRNDSSLRFPSYDSPRYSREGEDGFTSSQFGAVPTVFRVEQIANANTASWPALFHLVSAVSLGRTRIILRLVWPIPSFPPPLFSLLEETLTERELNAVRYQLRHGRCN